MNTKKMALDALEALLAQPADSFIPSRLWKQAEDAVTALEAVQDEPVIEFQCEHYPHDNKLYATPQQPAPGWKLVPIEPTPEMIGAMAVEEASGSINGVKTIGMAGAELAYEAALKAAPKEVT